MIKPRYFDMFRAKQPKRRVPLTLDSGSNNFASVLHEDDVVRRREDAVHIPGLMEEKGKNRMKKKRKERKKEKKHQTKSR